MCGRHAVCAAGLAAAILLAAACQSASPLPASDETASDETASDETAPLRGPDASEAAVAVFVVSNGWHTAIVIPRAAVPPGALPEAGDFPDAAHLSFGWGDAEYFPAPETTIAMTLRAALRPTPAVIHVAGLAEDPRAVYPAGEVVELRAAPRQFAALVAYLDASFERGGAERARAVQPGLEPGSRFYPAIGEFHLFNTCNTWTARGLEASGWQVRVSGVVTAEDIMVQVRALAARQAASLADGGAWGTGSASRWRRGARHRGR